MDAKPSYRAVTTNSIPTNDQLMDCISADDDSEDLEEDLINLSVEEKNRIYAPWQYSIIIKVFGGNVTNQFLKSKLEALWKLAEPLCLIDLGFGFFTAKFKGRDKT